MTERELIEEAVRTSEPLECMKVLIAIVSCDRDRECHQTIRETWAKDCPIDYKFFVGVGCAVQHEDEVLLDVADDFNSLPAKVQAVCAWAYERGYDFVFKCDTDSYVCVSRLLRSGFEKYHYSGCCGATANVYPDACFPANGGGYWLSRRAMEYLAYNMNLGLGKNCEDWCVFLSLMKGAGIFVHHDDRYRANRYLPGQGPNWKNNFIILHDAGDRNLRNPKYMREAHLAAQGL
jgi:hypothetical protein